ncbi:hypothetical protein GCM10023191_030340 [Actinoallomurus oryzae]|uniref:Uncharacterized protein n=1 Tax=Actinoallomurus oryzae TaxID=502180 RepID=A0ABP8PVJ6_9ACTN
MRPPAAPIAAGAVVRVGRRAGIGEFVGPFRGMDVATHALTLGTLGFSRLRYGIAGPSTRYLTAAKPT